MYNRVPPQKTPYIRTDQYVKIWFSLNPDVPLGGEKNEKRIVDHLTRNPDDTIHLIVDKTLLSDTGIKKLESFCSKHPNQIRLVDLETLSESLDERESKLLGYAKAELRHPYGNPAAASDIVRWLRPVLSRGIYTDFDVSISFNNDAKGHPNERRVSKEFMLSMHPSVDNNIVCDNNIIGIADANHPLVEIMQKGILSNYESPKGIYFSYPYRPGCPEELVNKQFDSVFSLRQHLLENYDQRVYMLDLKMRSGNLTDAFRQYCYSTSEYSGPLRWSAYRNVNVNDMRDRGEVMYYHESDLSWAPITISSTDRRTNVVKSDNVKATGIPPQATTSPETTPRVTAPVVGAKKEKSPSSTLVGEVTTTSTSVGVAKTAASTAPSSTLFKAPEVEFVGWQLKFLNTDNGRIIRTRQLLSDAELYDLSHHQLKFVVMGVTALEKKLINFQQIKELPPSMLEILLSPNGLTALEEKLITLEQIQSIRPNELSALINEALQTAKDAKKNVSPH